MSLAVCAVLVFQHGHQVAEVEPVAARESFYGLHGALPALHLEIPHVIIPVQLVAVRGPGSMKQLMQSSGWMRPVAVPGLMQARDCRRTTALAGLPGQLTLQASRTSGRAAARGHGKQAGRLFPRRRLDDGPDRRRGGTQSGRRQRGRRGRRRRGRRGPPAAPHEVALDSERRAAMHGVGATVAASEHPRVRARSPVRRALVRGGECKVHAVGGVNCRSRNSSVQGPLLRHMAPAAPELCHHSGLSNVLGRGRRGVGAGPGVADVCAQWARSPVAGLSDICSRR